MSDLSYRGINGRMIDIMERRDGEMEIVNTALAGTSISPLTKIQIGAAIRGGYDAELKMLTKMAMVADWHEMNAAVEGKL